MNFNCKYLKWFLILSLSFFLRSSYSFADNLKINLLNMSDVKVYKQAFKLQSNQIKSRNSKYGSNRKAKKI